MILKWNNLFVYFTMNSLMSALNTVESQSLNGVVTGFSFAAAIAWMDVVRWIVANVVKVNKSSGQFVLLAAVLTTMLAVAVYMVLKSLAPRVVNKPRDPMYAVVN